MTAPLLVVALAAVGAALGGVRWLRVAQREHYLAGSCTRFALRWWRSSRQNQLLLALSLAGLVAGGALAGAGGGWLALLGALPAVGAAVGPVGLGLRGRTGPLRWTGRLGRSAAVWAVLQVIPLVVAALVGTPSAVVVALAGLDVLAVPCLVDAALALLAPAEAAAGRRWIRAAEQRLEAVRPEVVGITGSYGKTSTKGYVAHLVAGTRSVVASPASFNNAMGLARTVNEHLAPGTEVLVAEMGAYGVGEIAALCSWTRPRIGAFLAVGPVHLERFRAVERIVQAKTELLDAVEVAVVNVGAPMLRPVADAVEHAGKRVWRCAAGEADDHPDAHVLLSSGPDGLRLRVRPPGAEQPLRPSPSGATQPPAQSSPAPAAAPSTRGSPPVIEPFEAVLPALPGAASNIACAIAIALELGVPGPVVLRRLGDLPGAPHRLQVSRAASGVEVLDDTYNSNPAGARRALELLATVGSPSGRRVLVTPGMVELGPLQVEENERLGRLAAAVATDVVIVGRTNRRALLDGVGAGAPGAGPGPMRGGAGQGAAEAVRAVVAEGTQLSGVSVDAARMRGGAGGAGEAGEAGGSSRPQVHCVATREEAVAWARRTLVAGDAILYENDLPDHYP